MKIEMVCVEKQETSEGRRIALGAAVFDQSIRAFRHDGTALTLLNVAPEAFALFGVGGKYTITVGE